MQVRVSYYFCANKVLCSILHLEVLQRAQHRASQTRPAIEDSLWNLSESNPGVCCGDLLAVNDLGLLEPLVALAQLDRLAVGRLVTELGKGSELLLKGEVLIWTWQRFAKLKRYRGKQWRKSSKRVTIGHEQNVLCKLRGKFTLCT